MFVLHFGKSVTVLGFIRFLSSLLFNIAFRMTGVEDTSNTNSCSISSKAKQLFNFFVVTGMREKISHVSVPVESVIPWSKLYFHCGSYLLNVVVVYLM